VCGDLWKDLKNVDADDHGEHEAEA